MLLLMMMMAPLQDMLCKVDCFGVEPDLTAQVTVKDLKDLVDYCVEDFMFRVVQGSNHIEA